MGWDVDYVGSDGEIIEVMRKLPMEEQKRLLEYAKFLTKYNQKKPSD
jgi:hypothetical protein